MAKASISDIVRSLALPIVAESGCELVDVEFIKEGADWFLRVYIDKDGGISLDDCEHVSKPLNKAIDDLDPIPHPFYLEVSSPGIERPLKKAKDFEKAIGKAVEVKLFVAVDGLKRFEGILESYNEKQISVKIESDEIKTFQLEQIAKIKTIIKF